MNTKQERYQAQRQRVLEATKGIDATVSPSQAAAMLPENPEWTDGIPKVQRPDQHARKDLVVCLRSPRRLQIGENQGRVQKAQRALREYLPPHEERQTGLIDLLADVRHYCAAHGLDFQAALDVSYRHYLVERKGEACES